MMKTFRQLLSMLAIGLACLARAETVPFVESFDERETGSLHNQNGWLAMRTNDVQVQGTAFEGAQAAGVGAGAVAWNSFTNVAATNVWIDFYARVPAFSNSAPPALTGSASAAFFIGADGKIRAISNSTWVVLGYTVAPGTWHRFSVNLDYKSRRWELHMAGAQPNELSTPVATNLAFSASSTNAYFQGFRIKN